MARRLTAAAAGLAMMAFGASEATAQSGGQWRAVFTEQGAGAKFGWTHPTYPDEFAGPFLECVEPGKTVSLVVPAEGLRPGQKPTLRFARDAELVELAAEVGPDEEAAGAMIGPSHPVYGLFRSAGTLTVQVGGKPQATFSLVSAPAAFARFAKACRLAGSGAAVGLSVPDGGKPAPKSLSAAECARRWARAEADGLARSQAEFAPCRQLLTCPASIQCKVVQAELPSYTEKDRLLSLCPSLAANAELVEKHQRYRGIARRLIGEYCRS